MTENFSATDIQEKNAIQQNTQLLDLSVLDSLSPEEKKVALQILEEYSQSGSSEKLNSMVMEDYNEMPVDILTFVDDNNYLGNAWHDSEGKSKLYPYWRDELIKLFPDNLTTTVNNAIFSGSRGRGKAQPLDSLVFTEHGYKKMGKLILGEKVYGNDGKLHPITGIYPQGTKKVYTITFSDKSETRCSDQHLWYVKDTDTGIWKTLELKDILHSALCTNRKYKYEIPLTQPLQFEHKHLFISSYLFGYLLSRGCFSTSISMKIQNQRILDYIQNELETQGHTCNLSDNSYLIKRIQKQNRANDYVVEVNRLGLTNHGSSDKFIPDIYLYNDITERINLMQGLLDGKSSFDRKNKAIIYGTCSKQLAEQIQFLIQSLGGTASIKQITNRTYKYKGEIKRASDYYSLTIKIPSTICPFKFSSNLDAFDYADEPKRYIKKIKFIGRRSCQCIMVDSDEHLYLTDNLIVTHNTEIAVLIAAYLLHRILCMKDPIAYFRLKPTEKIVFAFMNIKLSLAEEIGVAKFQNTIQSSPWFMAHGEIEGRTHRIWVPQKFNGQEAIDVKIGSQADDLIGLPIYFAFFDEVSFQRNQDIEKQKQKANDMIDTAIGGMKTRFVHEGRNPTLLVLASSKRSDKSFLEEHMRKKLRSEKSNVYISDGSVWEVKPKGTYSDKTFRIALGNKFLQSMVIPDEDPSDPYIAKGYQIIEAPIDFRADFLDDIDRALCDFAGISSSSITKYISGAAFQEVITDRIKNPFMREILEIGNGPDDYAQYYDFFDISHIDPKLKAKPLFIHLDMSISGDKTGIAGVFIKGKKPSTNPDLQSADLFYSLAFSVSIKAPKGRQVSFEKNRNFIRWLKRQGFNIKGITSDTFQAYDLQQQLKAEGYPCELLSVDRVDTDRICLLGDTLVKTPTGSKEIKDLIPGDQIYSYDIENDCEVLTTLDSWGETATVNDYIEIQTEDNKIIKCTEDHQILTKAGYKKARDLTESDEIITIPSAKLSVD